MEYFSQTFSFFTPHLVSQPPAMDQNNQRNEEPPQNDTRCSKCGRFNHALHQCKATTDIFGNDLRQVVRCTRCGRFNHDERQCNFDDDFLGNQLGYRVFCEKCGRYGHELSQCTHKGARLCYRCGGYGHDYKKCKEKFTIDDVEIKKIRVCEVCGEFGHLPKDCRTEVCIDGTLLEEKTKQCRRCGYSWHPESECLKPPPAKTKTPAKTPATTPAKTPAKASSDSSSSSSSGSSSSDSSSSESDSESRVARKKMKKGPRFRWEDIFPEDVAWMFDQDLDQSDKPCVKI